MSSQASNPVMFAWGLTFLLRDGEHEARPPTAVWSNVACVSCGSVSPQGSSFVFTPLDTFLCWLPYLKTGTVTLLEVKQASEDQQWVHGRGWAVAHGAAGELISG